MKNTLFNYPPQSEFNRIVAKEKIYQYSKPTAAIKDKFVSQVKQIKWQYKLAEETINLPAQQWVKEIQVFTLKLKAEELDDSVLHSIDKGINFPIIFQLSYKDKIKTTLAYKHPCGKNKNSWQISRYFASEWQHKDDEKIALPIALNLATLYLAILQQHLPLPQRTGENVEKQLERINQCDKLKAESRKIQSQIKKEKQFNRKVELNQKINTLKAEISRLQ